MTLNRTFFLLALLLLPATAAAQGFTPEEALKRMKVADGFEVKLVAAEPLVRQPVTMTFDERGRIWVIQYLQYPTPAGLKPVSVDQYLRTVYDKVPEPPPHGPKGVDKVTILEDTDGDGRMDKAKDFVTGLNLATGLCLGHGGVWVAQAPYLLFYPDKDGDDVPDGDPEVHLKGFGMEDAHAFANSLQWGPDGWLYGAQGSTVTAKINGVEFQQGVWRYHPRTKEFELFSEGGGNTWGLDFDRHGHVIAGTNWGDKAMLHQVQGGYHVKGFSKHGPLHNAHTYGYFEHVPYTGFKGGHVTCGGVIYRGDTFPETFRDQYIAANLLSNTIYWHNLERKGSTFTAKFGGELLNANDSWFRPIDCLVGPDGAVYVVDWYDKRANHVDPVDTWDRTNGRIYRIQSKDAPKPEPRELGKPTSAELVRLLGHRNAWWVREAQRLLTERRDPEVKGQLRQIVLDDKGQLALDALFALYVSGGFDDEFAVKLFVHANEDVRAWTVRLLGDAKKVSPRIQERLVDLARADESPVVRSQLACTAKRLPAKDGLAIVRELLKRKEDAADLYIPLLLWWAVEDKAVTDKELVLALFDSPEAWKVPLMSPFVAERLARRYMAESGKVGLEGCGWMLNNAPDKASLEDVMRGMEKALDGRVLSRKPPELDLEVLKRGGLDPLAVTRFAARLGDEEAFGRVTEKVADPKLPDAERVRLVELLSQSGSPAVFPALLGLLGDGNSPALRSAAVSGLQPFADAKITDTVLSLYAKMPADLRGKSRDLLAARPASALAMLKAVDARAIDSKEVPFDQLRRMRQLKSAEVDKLIEKHWGKIGAETAGEKVSRIRSIGGILRGGPGDPVKGKALFKEHCATCHQLFGEGNKVGPDLTSADRKNRDYLISQIVDPSAIVRPEFLAYNLVTTDGRTLTGLVAEETPTAVTLLDAKNEKTVVAREKIDELKASAASLMPDGLFDKFSEEMLRDLFVYMQGDAPPAPPPGHVMFKGHANTITCLAFAPGGKVLASGAKGGDVILWDVASGKVLATLGGHKDMVVAVAFSPDGKLLASTSHDTFVRLWDVASGKQAGELRGHVKDVRGVAFSPDGKTLATGGVDFTVKLWDAATRKELRTLEGHTAEVNVVCFSPDGKTLATAGWDNTVRLWAPTTGEARATLKGHTEMVRDVVFTPDGTSLLSSGKDGVIRVWDVAEGKCRSTLEGNVGLVRSLAVSPDGKRLASAARDGKLFIWDLAAGKTIAATDEGVLGFQVVAFSPDGKRLATGGIDRNVTLWNVDEVLDKHRVR